MATFKKEQGFWFIERTCSACGIEIIASARHQDLDVWNYEKVIDHWRFCPYCGVKIEKENEE